MLIYFHAVKLGERKITITFWADFLWVINIHVNIFEPNNFQVNSA